MSAIRWPRNIMRALAVGLIALTLLGAGYLVGANQSPSWSDGTATVFDNFATVESGGGGRTTLHRRSLGSILAALISGPVGLGAWTFYLGRKRKSALHG